MSNRLLQVTDCEQTREIRYVDSTLIPSIHIQNLMSPLATKEW